MSADSKPTNRDLVLRQLTELTKVGISVAALSGCDQLAIRAHGLSKCVELDLIMWRNPDTLMTLLKTFVQNERNIDPDERRGYVLAAAEFIGLADESVPDPDLASGEKSTPYTFRVKRGGPYLPPLKGGEPSSRYRNIYKRVSDSLGPFLNALDMFLRSDEHMNRFVALLRQDGDSAGSMGAVETDSVTPISSGRKSRNLYVGRPSLEAELKQAIDDGERLIALVGQPGMGKTWIANAVAQGAPRIRVVGGEIVSQDLVQALEPEALDHVIADPSGSRIALARLLSSAQPPPLIILDNLDSADELRLLLPVDITNTVIVATCRAKGVAPPLNEIRFIEVGIMERSEAKQIVKNIVPGVDNEDAEFIALTFGDYPLVVSYACVAFLRWGGSVREFCDDVKVDAAGEAAGVYTEEGASLVAVLRRLVGLVSSRDELALELLVCLSFSISSSMTINFLIEYLQRGDDRLTVRRCRRAIEVLLDFSLVTMSERHGLPVVDVFIHPFVREILLHEFQGSKVEVFGRAHRIYRSHIDHAFSTFESKTREEDISTEMATGAYMIFYQMDRMPATEAEYDAIMDETFGHEPRYWEFVRRHGR